MARAPGVDLHDLHDLPHPQHLFEHLTGSHHYHLGLSPGEDESLSASMDRLISAHLGSLRPGGRVLDVGAGMGGALELLAARGFRAVGIEPDASVASYGRSLLADEVELCQCGLFEYEGGPFDGLLLTEVLQHFPDLGALLARCRDLMVPGGVALIQGPALNVDASWERVPYHRAGAVADAARSVGLVVEQTRDLTEEVTPSLSRLSRLLAEQMDEMADRFATRPRIEAEIEELVGQVARLEAALEQGELGFEFVVLSRPGLQSS